MENKIRIRFIVICAIVVLIILSLVFGFLFNISALQTVGIVFLTILGTDASKFLWTVFEEKQDLLKKKSELYSMLYKCVYHYENIFDDMVGDKVAQRKYEELYEYIGENIYFLSEIFSNSIVKKLNRLYKKMTESLIFISDFSNFGDQARDHLIEVIELCKDLMKDLENYG